jgi:hypothetical protein
MNDEIGVVCVIGLEMHCIIVRSIHAFMHHKDTGFDCCAFAGLEYHRTDG